MAADLFEDLRGSPRLARDCCSRSRPSPAAEPRAVTAGDRRHLDHRVDPRHVLSPKGRQGRVDHQNALVQGGSPSPRSCPRSGSSRSPRAFDSPGAFQLLWHHLPVGDRQAARHLPASWRSPSTTRGAAGNPVKAIARAFAGTGHATKHHRGPRRRHAGETAPAGDRGSPPRDPHREPLRGASTGSASRSWPQLSMTGLIVALDAYGPVHRQRGRDRRGWSHLDEVGAARSRIRSTPSATRRKAVTKATPIGSAAPRPPLILFDSLHERSSRRRDLDTLRSRSTTPG